jgi:hypothetical protein
LNNGPSFFFPARLGVFTPEPGREDDADANTLFWAFSRSFAAKSYGTTLSILQDDKRTSDKWRQRKTGKENVIT